MKSKIVGLMAVFFIISCVSIFAMGEQDSAAKGTVLYSVGSYKGKPCYWQNTVRKNLSIPSGAKEGVASAINVGDDGTVYIAGYYGDFTEDETTNYPKIEASAKPCYWQNGVRKDLPVPSGAKYCEASAIAVETDGTVYVSGNYSDKFRYGWLYYLFNTCYWKDGGGRISIRDSFTGDGGGYGDAIAVGKDGTVYISGSYGDDDDYRSPEKKPCYWQNGRRINLPAPAKDNTSHSAAIALGANGTVYIAGTTGWSAFGANIKEEGTPCYWQNGVRKDLPVPSGAEDCEASAIAVGTDGRVYIAGSYTEWQNNNLIHKICYWQNGVRKELPVPSGAKYCEASAIAVETDGTVYVSGSYSYYGNYRNVVVCYWQGNTRYDISTLEESDIYSQFIVIK